VNVTQVMIGQVLTSFVAAEARKESRVGHAQEDCPKRDRVNWRVPSRAGLDPAKVTLGTRQVHLDPLTKAAESWIDLKKIAPKARVY
jgi:succinate dehydrogenase / fumarate reductase, flavoprotein subunit